MKRLALNDHFNDPAVNARASCAETWTEFKPVRPNFTQRLQTVRRRFNV